ncbi:YceI family protein [Methylophaga sp. OBS4]|uniref:YceI family protein n=1 Tax=Methylophaga sp. OBS4 TaxID=2991935 RepID=UPI002253F464|nr:YceI family protein [Methylophaga sp. OBS4]MCX4186888.1 YceI family protein [Methylophaga sp. OBS4]
MKILVWFTVMVWSYDLWAEPVCYHADADDSDIKFQFAIERSQFTGRFTDFQVDYCWQDAAPETGNISVTVNIASVQTGNSDLNIGMQEKDGLYTDNYPKATWTTQSIDKDGEAYFIKGELSIRGVTHEETGHFKLNKEDGNWRLTGSSTVKRLDYNVGIGEFADAEFIPNDVTVEFNFALKKQ